MKKPKISLMRKQDKKNSPAKSGGLFMAKNIVTISGRFPLFPLFFFMIKFLIISMRAGYGMKKRQLKY